MPNAYGWIDADQTVPVKKSIGLTCRKNSIVWAASTITIPTVVSDAERRGERTAAPR